MALPSSPPLLPSDDDLPALPTFHPLSPSSRAPIGPHTRKRSRADFASQSSDPIFSDTTEGDDVQEDVGELPRRKRVVRGPWWSLQLRGERHLRRNVVASRKGEGLRVADSGVWMGSDVSDVSMDGIIASQQRMQDLVMEDAVLETQAEPAPDAEDLATRIIQNCVDVGNEAVDLSDLGLKQISNASLRPLHHLIKTTFNNRLHPPSEDEFGPLTPSIKLYLSNNQLTALPTELFELTTVDVLSLRNNQLTQLPCAVARLTKIKELNISGNNIRILPWELLDLIHCRDGQHRQILVTPNPLVQPADLGGPSPLTRAHFQSLVKSEDFSRFADTRETIAKMRRVLEEQGRLNLRAELELRLKLGRMLRIQYLQDASRSGSELKMCREELIYLASSAIRYYNVDGTPVRRLADPEDWTASLDPEADLPRFNHSSATVPSLLELALRRVQTVYDMQDFTSKLSSMDVSSTLSASIRRAAKNAAAYGNEICSTCGRGFVIARAEWMEYWFNGYPSRPQLSAETALPFLRRACSWGCAKVTEVGSFKC